LDRVLIPLEPESLCTEDNVSDFDLASPVWVVEPHARKKNLPLFSVIERSGSSRYWFGPFKQHEIEPFIESRRTIFERMSRLRSITKNPARPEFAAGARLSNVLQAAG